MKDSCSINSNNQLSKILDVSVDTINVHKRKLKLTSKNISSYENEIFDYISTIYNGEIVRNTKSILIDREIDIYLPDKNLAIEFDGIYWHSFNNGKLNNFHLHKTNDCEKQGIQLLHIFENEWINKNDIWKSVIANKLGVHKHKIGARKCTIK
jgi:hypothetical protein